MLLTSASLAQAADSVTLTQNAYSYSVGGEFSAATTGDFIVNYAPAATIGSDFETFCVQASVDFSPNTTYTYTLSDYDSQGRALSEGAAYLYYEFGLGQLAGYNYANAAIRKADAGELQAALWALQGGQSYAGFPSLATDPFYELATNTLGSAATNADNGVYDVEILQMWNANGTAAQNQLVLLDPPSSVPDGASTGGMLAFVCAGLIVWAKRGTPALASVRTRRRKQLEHLTSSGRGGQHGGPVDENNPVF
ncbi:MAG TPA: hypothetical protein VH595_09685 [Verrucomicrobiae bacterium]|nr:hypothetical protein [Verrucomicrobiae bacterium]